jgi:replication factor C subunit 3/5
MSAASDAPMSASAATSALSAPTQGGTLPWVEKYRPTTLEGLVSNDAIISTLQRLIASKQLPHLLFYGPPGTGKTSTILAAAREIYGKNYQSQILELNASDDRGIAVVRDQIKAFANTRNIFSSGAKLIVLDEADAMTAAAQAALRRIIEKYTRTTRFCIICNYLDKLIPALQSRCTRFRFAPLKDDAVRGLLEEVAKEENVTFGDGGLDAVLRLGRGDMRRALHIMQSAHTAADVVDEAVVYECTGNPRPGDIKCMVEWMLQLSYADAFRKVERLRALKGLAVSDLLTEVHTFALALDLDGDLRIELLKQLAEAEFRLSTGGSEKINLGAIVAAFVLTREKMFERQRQSQASATTGSMDTQP